MEIEKIRNLSDEQLVGEQTKAAEELFRLRFRMNLGNAEGVKKLHGLKLDIARFKTVARERVLHIERVAKPEATSPKATAGAKSEAAEKPARKTAAKKAPAKTAAKKSAAKKTAKKTTKKAAAKKA